MPAPVIPAPERGRTALAGAGGARRRCGAAPSAPREAGTDARTTPVPSPRLAAHRRDLRACRIIGVAMIYSTTGGWRLPVVAAVRGHHRRGRLRDLPRVDYRALTDKSHFIYLALLGLLIYVLVFGTTAGGARRWISFGSFNLQPSEFAKLGVALVLAKFFGENRRGAPTSGDLVIGGASRRRSRSSSSRASPISERPSRWCRFFSGSDMSPACACACSASSRPSPSSRRRSHGITRSSPIRRAASKRSSIRRWIRRAPAISRSRRRSRWDRAACGAKAIARARRDSSGSCRSPTTTSFFRRWRRNRVLPESCSC